MAKKDTYDADSISVLEGLEAVRKRPGMYIGDTDDGSGLHQLVYEVVDNSIDEVLAGFAKDVVITIHNDESISVLDDGRGIPNEVKFDDKHKPKRSAAEIALTELHAGGKFNENSYKISGGLHGVGVSCVNALSTWLRLTVYRDGRAYRLNFEKGKVVNRKIETVKLPSGEEVTISPMEDIGPSPDHKSGTLVEFLPDSEIFKNVLHFNYDTLLNRLRELSFLNSGAHIILIDERTGREADLKSENGVRGFVKYLNEQADRTPVNPEPFHAIKTVYSQDVPVSVEVAMQWHNGYNEVLDAYTNNIHQRDGGTHVTGLRNAMTRVLKNYISAAGMDKKAKVELDPLDMREGLTCVLSVKVPQPKFSSQTKDKLVSSEVRPAVEEVINSELTAYLEENPGTIAVVSGGRGPGEDITEAEVMKEYLLLHGIDEKRILVETDSTTTSENLDYTGKLIDREKKVGLVTNNFHIYRALKMAKKQGYTNVSGLAAPSDPLYQIHYLVREFFAMIKAVARGDISLR